MHHIFNQIKTQNYTSGVSQTNIFIRFKMLTYYMKRCSNGTRKNKHGNCIKKTEKKDVQMAQEKINMGIVKKIEKFFKYFIET